MKSKISSQLANLPLLSLNEDDGSGDADDVLKHGLRSLRIHLGLDVAFISEFTGGNRVFRHVDSAMPDRPISVGRADPLEDTYCQRIVDGRIPQLIQDVSQLPELKDLPVTGALGIGNYMGVPILLKDGSVYGTRFKQSGGL